MTEMTTAPLHLVVDRAACAGHGMCYATAPSLIEPDEQGEPVLPSGRLGAEQVTEADAAVAACPERALSLSTRILATEPEEHP